MCRSVMALKRWSTSSSRSELEATDEPKRAVRAAGGGRFMPGLTYGNRGGAVISPPGGSMRDADQPDSGRQEPAPTRNACGRTYRRDTRFRSRTSAPQHRQIRRCTPSLALHTRQLVPPRRGAGTKDADVPGDDRAASSRRGTSRQRRRGMSDREARVGVDLQKGRSGAQRS